MPSVYAVGDKVTIARELGQLDIGGTSIGHGDVGTVVGAEDDVYDIDFAGYLVEGLPHTAQGVAIIEPAPDGVDPMDSTFGMQDGGA